MNYSKLLKYHQGVLKPQSLKAKKSLKDKRVDYYVLERDRLEILQFAKQLKKNVAVLMHPLEIYQLGMLVKNLRKVKGDIAEVGAYKGGSARVICEYKKNKHLHVVDTFSGLPAARKNDKNIVMNNAYKQGQYASSLEEVKELLKPFINVHLYPVHFKYNNELFTNHIFSLVHLDLDVYQSTIDCLKYFYPRMTSGGVIITHDYQSASGVKKAFDEFFKNKPEIIIELAVTQAMVVVL